MSKIKKYITNTLQYVCWGFGVALVVFTLIQIILRSITNLPLSWTDEVLKLSFTWFCMLAAVLAFWEGGHINIDYFINLLPRKVRAWVVILERFLTLSVIILIIPFTIDLVGNAHGQKTIMLGIPMSWSYAAFPTAFSIMAFDRLIALLRSLRQRDVS